VGIYIQWPANCVRTIFWIGSSQPKAPPFELYSNQLARKCKAKTDTCQEQHENPAYITWSHAQSGTYAWHYYYYHFGDEWTQLRHLDLHLHLNLMPSQNQVLSETFSPFPIIPDVSRCWTAVNEIGLPSTIPCHYRSCWELEWQPQDGLSTFPSGPRSSRHN
jgi:hypothetical protein